MFCFDIEKYSLSTGFKSVIPEACCNPSKRDLGSVDFRGDEMPEFNRRTSLELVLSKYMGLYTDTGEGPRKCS